jgi:hypothetical protein
LGSQLGNYTSLLIAIAIFFKRLNEYASLAVQTTRTESPLLLGMTDLVDSGLIGDFSGMLLRKA